MKIRLTVCAAAACCAIALALLVFPRAGSGSAPSGGDGQAPVPPGTYTVRVTVNPGYVPTRNEICRHADPNRKGVCHALPESNYENNVGEVSITIPDHPGRSGVGPLKDQPAARRTT